MIRTHRIYIIFAAIVCCFLPDIQAQEDYGRYLNYERNYDDLLHSYYIETNEKLLNQRFPSSESASVVSNAKQVPDEVYRQRLNSIPSAVKLVYNSDVRAHIVYYLDRMNRSVSVMLGVSKYYFPIFENILDSYGVPSELKYLVMIESAFNPKAVSKAGATGLWQFMYATGRTYDLRVNSVVDDRCDPIKSTIAAAKFLKDLYNIYNDWSLVLAAYNCGPGNVNKAMKRSGKKDFWEIYSYLPRETRNYVPAYIAATYVMNFYHEHGISPAELTRPLDLITDTVMLSKDIYFGQIEEVMHISVAELKDLNPQYKMDFIPATQDKYSLRLPLKHINDFIELEDSISRCNIEKYRSNSGEEDTNIVYVDKTITHKVKANETWSSIARRYGTTVSELRRWNPRIKKNKLQKGTLLSVKTKVAVKKSNIIAKDETQDSSSFKQDEILEANSSDSQQEVVTSAKNADKINNASSTKKVEAKAQSKPAEKKQDNKQSSTKTQNNSKQQNNSAQNNSKQQNKNSSSPATHTIKSGETVGSIAKKYGISEQKLMKLNGLNDASARKLRPGQKLKLR